MTVNLERIHKDIARITSDNVDPVEELSLTMLIIGQLGRICEDIARIISDNVDPAGWSINGQPGKDPQRHCKDYL